MSDVGGWSPIHSGGLDAPEFAWKNFEVASDCCTGIQSLLNQLLINKNNPAGDHYTHKILKHFVWHTLWNVLEMSKTAV